MKKHKSPVTNHQSLSVVLATRNEEANIGPCLESVKGIADEIVIVDEDSTDKTRDIAEKYGAEVYKVKHEPIFHINKQEALEKATGDWILQLDADERVTDRLSNEIKRVINSPNIDLKKRLLVHLFEPEPQSRRPERAQRVEGHSGKKLKLFKRHQRVIEKRDGKIGKPTGEVVAFFIPRLNFFLGKPLIHAGVYPDASIRLVRSGKAYFPAKSVHEQMRVDGEVAWLFNDLEHHDSPTFRRYLERMNRYTDLHAEELKEKKIPRNLFYMLLYTSYLPAVSFLKLYIRHRGFLDGMRGFIWSLFSALHFPLAYFKYWQIAKS